MPTPPNLQFDREQFLSGGPGGPETEEVVEIRVADRKNTLLYRFNSMLVTQIGNADVERANYFMNANGKVSMFAFGRALNMMRLQCVLIDAVNRAEVVEALNSGEPADSLGVKSQQAYEEFMALYERELRFSTARRNGRKISLFVRGQMYTGFVTGVNAGFAANADWLAIANIEFIVLSATTLNYSSSVLSVPLRTES